MRRLVVEDEPRLAADLRAALEAAGYAVDVADDGSAPLLSITNSKVIVPPRSNTKRHGAGNIVALKFLTDELALDKA